MAAAKTPAKSKSAADSGVAADIEPGALQPRKPEGYEPVGEIEVLAQSAIARVVTDGVLVWKEAL